MKNYLNFHLFYIKRIKIGNEEFLNNHLSTVTNNILNMNINENKIANFEIDIINNIFEKENESDKFYWELSEDSNNFIISSNISLINNEKLKNNNKEKNKAGNNRKKNISKKEAKNGKRIINNKNLINNLILNKKLNDDQSSSDGDCSNNSSNSLKIEPESDNEYSFKKIIINHEEIASEIIDL